MTMRKTNFYYLHHITIFCNKVYQILQMKLQSLSGSTALVENQGYSE